MTIFVRDVSSGTPTGVAGVYDYNSLKQAVSDWFARSDLANYVDYFIQMAEADIYRDIFSINQGAGVQPIETSFSSTIDTTTGTIALPTGYLGLKIATLVMNSSCAYELVRKNQEYIFTNYPFRGAGAPPQYIARQGQTFIFGPSPDSAYTVSGTYWQKSPQLTQVNSVNWMVEQIPTVLLAAVCRACARFNKDAEALQMWDSLYQPALADFVMTDRAEELSGSSLAMTVA